MQKNLAAVSPEAWCILNIILSRKLASQRVKYRHINYSHDLKLYLSKTYRVSSLLCKLVFALYIIMTFSFVSYATKWYPQVEKCLKESWLSYSVIGRIAYFDK